MKKDERPGGIGGWVRRLERRLADASIRWRHGHAMKRPHAPAAPGVHPLVMVCDHLHPRENIGRIIRAAESFGAREVHLIGTTVFDPATATTALHRIPLRYYSSVDACFTALRREGYEIVVIETPDEAEDASVLQRVSLPERCALVVGNEKRGVSFTPADHADARWVSIERYGATECLDVGSAAAIALYEWTRQWGGAAARAPRAR